MKKSRQISRNRNRKLIYRKTINERAKEAYIKRGKFSAVQVIHCSTCCGLRKARKYVDKFCTPSNGEILAYKLGNL